MKIIGFQFDKCLSFSKYPASYFIRIKGPNIYRFIGEKIWSFTLLRYRETCPQNFMKIREPCFWTTLHGLIRDTLLILWKREFQNFAHFLGHLSHSGDLLSLCVVRRPLTSQKLLGQSLPNLVCSICRVRRQEIVNFMTPHPKGR